MIAVEEWIWRRLQGWRYVGRDVDSFIFSCLGGCQSTTLFEQRVRGNDLLRLGRRGVDYIHADLIFDSEEGCVRVSKRTVTKKSRKDAKSNDQIGCTVLSTFWQPILRTCLDYLAPQQFWRCTQSTARIQIGCLERGTKAIANVSLVLTLNGSEVWTYSRLGICCILGWSSRRFSCS